MGAGWESKPYSYICLHIQLFILEIYKQCRYIIKNKIVNPLKSPRLYLNIFHFLPFNHRNWWQFSHTMGVLIIFKNNEVYKSFQLKKIILENILKTFSSHPSNLKLTLSQNLHFTFDSSYHHQITTSDHIFYLSPVGIQQWAHICWPKFLYMTLE